MKDYVTILFNFPRDKFELAKKVFVAMGWKNLAEETEREFGYLFKWEINDPVLAKFRVETKKYGFSIGETITRKYNPKELQEYDAFILQVKSKPIFLKEYIDISDKSESYCTNCGTGTTQQSNLVIGIDKLEKSKETLFQTEDGKIIINRTLLNKINKLSGTSFRKILTEDRKELNFYQLLSKKNLPPISPSSKGVITSKRCKDCKRDGYFNTIKEPLEIHYPKFVLTMLKNNDLLSTWEYFGKSTLKGNHTCGANPLLILTKKGINKINELNLKNIDFIPIIFD